MKCILPLLSVALCAASTVFAAPTLGGADWAPAYQGEKDALMTPTLTVPAEGAARVWAEWSQGDTTVRVDFTEDGGMWSADLPANHAGQVDCTIYAEDADGVPADMPQYVGYVLSENTDDARGLTNQRYPYMNDWAGSGVNLDADWYGVGYSRDISSLPQAITLRGTSTDVVPSTTGTTAGGFVRTRAQIVDGVGSVWFKAKMSELSAPNGTLVLEKITYTIKNGRPVYAYHDIAEITVPKATGVYEWHQFHLLVQDAPATEGDRAYYRIRNKTMAENDNDRANKAIDICDIVLTPVIPDVKIYKDELDYAPGFPSIQDPIEFHIAVSNVFPLAPATHFTPRLNWRQGTRAAWTNTPMTNIVHYTNQGDGVYACVLTPEENGLSDGPFEYFYTVDFTGYTPTFPAIKDSGIAEFNLVVNDRFDWKRYPYLIHTNAWGLLTDADGNVSECRSPAACPTFADTFEKTHAGAFYHYSRSYDVATNMPAADGIWDFTRKFDLFHLDEGWPSGTLHYMVRPNKNLACPEKSTYQIQGTYEYNTFLAKDGVRRFRSMFTDLAAVTADFSTNTPSFLDRAYPMQHVGDYTWQAILHVTNAVDAYFSVTGAYQALQGATAYDAGPFEWVQFDQDATYINPPMSGQEDDGSQLRGFPMTGFERTVTITGRYTNTLWDVTMTPGLWVGVVTNAVETNELGQAIVPPTADDVAFWYEKITYGEPDEQGNVQTNHDFQAYNYTLNVVDPDHPELSTVTTNEYFEFYDYIFTDNPWLVTNEWSVGTAVTKTLVPGEEWSREETVTEWRLDEDDPEFDGHSLRTRVQIDYDGFLMYRFCTTNGAYQIRRAAWQDFNAWQADENEYSRSFGLYDMKTFETDLEGRALTTFAQSLNSVLIDSVPAMNGYSPASGQYMYGYIGKNAKVLKDRVLSDNAPDWTSKTRNTEVVLRGYPGVEGSLETTSENKGAGRGTLKMRVRSHTDDDRNIVYTGTVNPDTGAYQAQGWKNYRVMARIMSPNANDVSDAEHSLSLIGYWKDPNNYWEARITQKSELMADQKGRTRNWFEVHVYAWIDGEPHEQYGYVQGSNYGWNWNQSYQASDSKRPTWPGWNSNSNTGDRNDQGRWNKGSDADYGLFTLNRTAKVNNVDKPVRWCFVFDLATDGTKVTPMVWGFMSNDIEAGTCDGGTLANALAGSGLPSKYYLCKFSPIECSSGAFQGATTQGCPGFNMRDCGLQIAPYVFGIAEAVKLDKSTGPGFSAVPTAAQASWYHSDDASYDRNHKIDVWTVTPGSDSKQSPTIVTRPAPKVWYGIRTFRTEKEDFPDGMFVASVPFYQNGITRDWDKDWDAYNGHAGDHDQSVEQYSWKTVPFAMNLWDQTFISIQALSENEDGTEKSLGNLAVDSITCDDWRGVTVWDEEFENTNIAATVSFGATYAAIAADGRTGRRYELNRSRANPNRVQAITTPLLVHGVGDILFNYEVAEHPVQVSVQLGDSTGSEWNDLSSQVLPVGSEGSIYVPCLSNQTGRLRIVAGTPEGAADGALGTLYVDNVRATDYPNTGDTSWEVYNALVSTFPPTVSQRVTPPYDSNKLRGLKFDGATDAAATFRSAVLNDGSANQTLQGHVFDEHVPYVQTPSIETGVGEVSFWYRASPDNTGPAKLDLKLAKAGSTPDTEWVSMCVTNLYWDNQTYSNAVDDAEYVRQCEALNALTNITTSTWTYFSVEFYEKDYRMLRLVGLTNDTNRVMLDNVLITEPVRSSVDVGSIEFSPGVPLSTRPTDVTVRLVNPRMQPENIEVFLDWYAGTGDMVEFGITNTTYEVLTNKTTTTEDLGNGYSLVHTVTTYKTNYFHEVDVTRFRGSLSDPESDWGYSRWADLQPSPTTKGTISFTNAPDQAYTFLSSNSIPTNLLEPDTVVQYCVRVKYTGRFASPVLSETQGRVKNGYWFKNPDWYYPIDLNETFSTTERPVSHFYVFSCPTNTVFFNEFRPWMGKQNNQDKQFVELIGPLGANVKNWRIEHFGIANGALQYDWVFYTNTLGQADNMLPLKEPKFHVSDNQTTNKGWGVYVLGCSAIAGRDEALFLPEHEQNDDDGDQHPFLNVPGALRLRRSMGAWVDRIAWGRQNNLTDFTRNGFTWANNIGSFTNDRYIYWTFAREGDADAEDLVWNTTATGTIGGFNSSEEMFLPSLLDDSTATKEIALIARPEITGMTFTEDGASIRITFSVSVTNGIPLDADSKYTWDVEEAGELSEDADWTSMAGWDRIEEMPASITAPADGTPASYTIQVPYDKDVRFFQIKASWK